MTPGARGAAGARLIRRRREQAREQVVHAERGQRLAALAVRGQIAEREQRDARRLQRRRARAPAVRRRAHRGHQCLRARADARARERPSTDGAACLQASAGSG